MKKTLIIQGDLSKVLTAIPALEKFVINNPDCTIIIYEYIALFWGNKILVNNIFDSNTKDNYQRIKNTKITKPDPYLNSDFLNGKISLIDAWNQEINGNKEHLSFPSIHLQEYEKIIGTSVRKNYFSKVIAFQPFSNDVEFFEGQIKDKSCKSLNVKTCKELVKKIKNQGYGLWLITDREVPVLNSSDFINIWPSDPRAYAAIMSQCDYFVGVDGSGQHLARSFNLPGTVIMGGSNTVNNTYPDHFNILNDKPNRDYMPVGLAEFDRYLAEANNDSILSFDDNEIKELCNNVIKHIKKSTKR